MKMETIIPYKNLSDDIRKEIEVYHEQRVQDGLAHSLQTSTKEWFKSSFEEWFLSNKTDGSGNNKRSSIRVNVELPITVADTLIENQQTEGIDLNIAGTVENISRGGLYFKSSCPYSISSILKLTINFGILDPDFPAVDALAMVIRSQQIDEHSYGIGVSFSSIYNDDLDMLHMFIFKQLTMYISNN